MNKPYNEYLQKKYDPVFERVFVAAQEPGRNLEDSLAEHIREFEVGDVGEHKLIANLRIKSWFQDYAIRTGHLMPKEEREARKAAKEASA